jgi:tetratricopeptide (TPR) repeat protein
MRKSPVKGLSSEKLCAKAWESYEAEDYNGSLKIFEQALRRAANSEQRDSFLSRSCYALVALRRFAKARAIYKTLFAKYHSHIYLHQLGMVERESGNYKKALQLYKQEQKLIDKKDPLAAAANLYELGKNNELLCKIAAAKVYSGRCITVSLKCRDKVMKGCAFRLAGDIARHNDINAAIKLYKRAKEYFHSAAEKKGAQEIDNLLNRLSAPARSSFLNIGH